MDDKRDEIPDEELERIDRYAGEDIASRESNIGTVARARTIRRLVEEMRPGAGEDAPIFREA